MRSWRSENTFGESVLSCAAGPFSLCVIVLVPGIASCILIQGTGEAKGGAAGFYYSSLSAGFMRHPKQCKLLLLKESKVTTLRINPSTQGPFRDKPHLNHSRELGGHAPHSQPEESHNVAPQEKERLARSVAVTLID